MRQTGYRWVIVGVLWLVHAYVSLNVSSIGILAPLMQEELRLSSFQIGVMISALSIGASLSQMPAGLFVDFAGVRRMLTLATALLGVLLALFSQTPAYPLALLVLLLYGMANGIVGPAASKSVLDWFPSVGRATAMGLKQTGVNFGGIFAGLLLPVLALFLSWRQSLLAVGVFEALTAMLVYRLLKEAPEPSGAGRETIAWQKILWMARQREMLVLGGIAFCFMAAQFSFSTYLILFLTREMKFSIVEAGQYFSLSFLTGAAGRVLWSMASDYFLGGRRKGVLGLITVILLLSSLLLGTISFFPHLSPLLLPAVVAFGVSGIGWNAIYLTMLAETAGKGSTGLATGVGYFLGFLGNVICPPLFGLLVDWTGVYAYAWLLLVACALAILILLRLFRERGAAAGGPEGSGAA